MSKSKKILIGYYYSVGVQFVLCQGPIDKVTKIWVDDRLAWSGDSTNINYPTISVLDPNFFGRASENGAPNRITINQPGLFGGDKQEGGIAGYIDIANGSQDQPQNDYLRSKLGADVPAYRGVCSAILRRVYIGLNPYLKPWRFRAQRIHKDPNGGQQWYPAKAAINTYDMNPAHIIREVLTSNSHDWGLALNPSLIDSNSFMTAADTLHNEGLGLSFLWQKDSSCMDFIQRVNDHINGVLIKNRTTGKFQLRLLRPDYDPGSVRVLGVDTVLKVEKFKEAQISEMANQIIVKYWDRETGKLSSVGVQNLALIDTIGGVNCMEVKYPGCCTADLANKLAQRDLASQTRPLCSVTLVCNKRAYDLQQADIVTLDLPHETIPSVVFRVESVGYGQNGEQIKIALIQDEYAAVSDSLIASPPPRWEDPITDPAPATYRKLFEASYYDLVKAIGEGDTLAMDEDNTTFSIAAGRPSQDTLSFTVYDADTEQERGDSTPVAVGVLAAGIDKTATVINFTTVLDLQDMAVGEVAAIGSERVMISAVNGTELTLLRGVEDTIPADHLAGEVLYLIGDVTYMEVEQFVTGQDVNIKLLTGTGLGELLPVDAPTDNLTFVGRQGKPYPPANIQIKGEINPVEVSATAGAAIEVTHVSRNRKQQTAGFIGWYNNASIAAEEDARTHYELKSGGAVIQSGDVAANESINLPTDTLTNGSYTFEAWAERVGIESLQRYIHTFDLDLLGGAINLVTGYQSGYINSNNLSLAASANARTTDWFTLQSLGGTIEITPIGDAAAFNRFRMQTIPIEGVYERIHYEDHTGILPLTSLQLSSDAKEVRIYFSNIVNTHPGAGLFITHVPMEPQIATDAVDINTGFSSGRFSSGSETLIVDPNSFTTDWMDCQDLGVRHVITQPNDRSIRNRNRYQYRTITDDSSTNAFVFNSDDYGRGDFTLPADAVQFRIYYANNYLPPDDQPSEIEVYLTA